MGDFSCALGLYKNSVMRKLFETSPAIDFKGIMMLNEIYQSFNDLLFFLQSGIYCSQCRRRRFQATKSVDMA